MMNQGANMGGNPNMIPNRASPNPMGTPVNPQQRPVSGM